MLGRKIRNVRYALEGLRIAWREEFNFRVQIGIAFLALFLGWYFAIAAFEWLVLILAIGAVLSAEIFNTALEELCDKFKADPDPHIAKIKDLSAAAVLTASFAALLVGSVIFLPRILDVIA